LVLGSGIDCFLFFFCFGFGFGFGFCLVFGSVLDSDIDFISIDWFFLGLAKYIIRLSFHVWIQYSPARMVQEEHRRPSRACRRVQQQHCLRDLPAEDGRPEWYELNCYKLL
jgi:hypothetical protein